MIVIGYIILAYLVGSIPTGLIVGNVFFKKDLREYGSKNIGATNALRVLGKKAAITVLLFDVLKGIIGVNLLLGNPILMVVGGVAAMIGHNWSLFLKFKGGKGVATGLGVLIALMPQITFFIVAIFIGVVVITRYVSLASIIAAISAPILMVVFNKPIPFILFGIVAALFIVIRHKTNIQRLRNGTELKINWRNN